MQSWVGVPVAELDRHPIFLTMQVVRTRTSDGTEIRNFVNGRNVASCSGGGSAFAGYVDMTTYSQFTDCNANIRRLQQYLLHQGRCRHAILADRYWRYALLHDRATEAELCRCREHSMRRMRRWARCANALRR